MYYVLLLKLIPSLTSYIQISIHLTSLKLILAIHDLPMTKLHNFHFGKQIDALKMLIWWCQFLLTPTFSVLPLPALTKSLNAHVLWFFLWSIHTLQLTLHKSLLLNSPVTRAFSYFLLLFMVPLTCVTSLLNAFYFLLLTWRSHGTSYFSVITFIEILNFHLLLRKFVLLN